MCRLAAGWFALRRLFECQAAGWHPAACGIPWSGGSTLLGGCVAWPLHVPKAHQLMLIILSLGGLLLSQMQTCIERIGPTFWPFLLAGGGAIAGIIIGILVAFGIVAGLVYYVRRKRHLEAQGDPIDSKARFQRFEGGWVAIMSVPIGRSESGGPKQCCT